MTTALPRPTPRWLARHIAAAHDTDPERETFTPARLAGGAPAGAAGARLPSTWLAVGDSITEGMNASTRDKRWINRATAKLRALAGVTGGAGYLPAWQMTVADGGGFLWPSPWTAAGDVTLTDWTDTLGKRGALLAAGASMAVTVDGGPAVPVPTDGPYGGVAVTRVPFPSRGTRTVVIASPAGATILGGVMVYDGDEDSGVRLYDAAHSGWTSTQAVTFTAGSLAALAAAAAPDLITVGLGVNDLSAGIAAGSSAFNVGAILDEILPAAPRARVVVVVTYAPAGNDAAWAPYVDQLRYTAATRGCDLLDLRARMGVAGTSGYWAADGLHPSDAGHELIADLLVDLLRR